MMVTDLLSYMFSGTPKRSLESPWLKRIAVPALLLCGWHTFRPLRD